MKSLHVRGAICRIVQGEEQRLQENCWSIQTITFPCGRHRTQEGLEGGPSKPAPPVATPQIRKSQDHWCKVANESYEHTVTILLPPSGVELCFFLLPEILDL